MSESPDQKASPKMDSKITKKSISGRINADMDPSEAGQKNDEDFEEIIDRLEKTIDEQKGDIEELHKKNKECKNEYLRQVAEMDNLRKRLEREKSEYFQYALSEIFKEFLEILDNFERALEAQESSGKEQSFRQGVDMIHRQIKDLLKKYDVKPLEETDSAFDPNIHQAFMTEKSDAVESPQITEVFQKGYRLGNRLLRPALVKVAVPDKEKD